MINKLPFKIIMIVLVTLLLIGTSILATEKGRENSGLVSGYKAIIESKNQQKETSRKTKTFIPKDKVTADQAVAFPTDI